MLVGALPATVMVRVAITGANGFIGSALSRHLVCQGHFVVAVCRPDADLRSLSGIGLERREVVDPSLVSAWERTLREVDCVVHLGGRAHVSHHAVRDAYVRHWLDNTQTSLAVATAAAELGLNRLLYLSSVNASLELLPHTRSSSADRPRDPYGTSKAAAERLIHEVFNARGDALVLRVPTVVGPGTRGRIATLFRMLHRSLPVPVSYRQRRSVLGLTNLCEAVERACTQDLPRGGVYYLADPVPTSVAAIARIAARQMDRRPLLVPVPPSVLRALSLLPGRPATLSRLLSDLVVDSTRFSVEFSWEPRVDTASAVRAAVDSFLCSRSPLPC